MSINNRILRQHVISIGILGCLLFAYLLPIAASPLPRSYRTVRLARSFDLRQGQVVKLHGTKILIKLVEINDSRCPKNVTCVWAGNGAVKLDVSLNGRNSETITLNTAKTATLPGEQVYGSYTISLWALNPYPVTGRKQPGKYATLIITKTRSR
jgi:hypothetical protein